MNNILNKKNEGFTLIELLVATSIFVIVALGALAVLISSQRVYKRISNTRVAIDNINTVIDTMSREIKFGKDYACINDTSSNQIFTPSSPSLPTAYNIPTDSYSNNCDAIAFTPQGESTTTKTIYYYDRNELSIKEGDYKNNNLQRVIPITSSEIKIDSFWFNVIGSLKSDMSQPKVEIFASGVIDTMKNGQGVVVATSTFKIQSVASQKILDN